MIFLLPKGYKKVTRATGPPHVGIEKEPYTMSESTAEDRGKAVFEFRLFRYELRLDNGSCWGAGGRYRTPHVKLENNIIVFDTTKLHTP